RAGADAVAVVQPDDLAGAAPRLVPGTRARLVASGPADRKDAVEEVDLRGRAEPRAGSHRLVEPADLLEHVPAYGETRTVAEHAAGRRVEHDRFLVGLERDREPRVGLTDCADPAGDERRLRIRRETADERVRPGR